MEQTTIQLDKRAKNNLKKQKLYPNESSDKVIQRLIQNEDHDDGLSTLTIKNIEKAIADIKSKILYTANQVNKELGLA